MQSHDVTWTAPVSYVGHLTTTDVEELASALGQVTRPWIQEAMRKAAGPDGKHPVVIDVDLTGQRGGPDSHITGTAFGYMDGQLAKGYQIAAAFLAGSADWLAIAATLEPGHSKSVPCLMELLPRIEARIGRPRRSASPFFSAPHAYQRNPIISGKNCIHSHSGERRLPTVDAAT